MNRFAHTCTRTAAVCVALALLAGCVPAVVGVVGVGVSEVALDRRTLGRHLDDQTLSARAFSALKQAPELIGARLNVTAHNGLVLLTGEIQHEIDRNRVEDIVLAQGATSVLDKLEVVSKPGLVDRANDLRIEAQIKVKLALNPNTPANAVKLVSERGQVYLLGLVTKTEAEYVVAEVKSVSGVNHIVLAFEYIR